MIYCKYSFLLLICCVCTAWAQAQKKIQVAVRTVTQEIAIKPGNRLIVIGEKSQIKIVGWDKNTIGLELKLIAKHPEKDVAVTDLTQNHYEVTNGEKTVTVRNFFGSTEKFVSVRSNLSAGYVIHVPQDIIVDVRNTYGSISIEHSKSSIEVTGKLSSIDIRQTEGEISIVSHYGDITLNQAQGVLKIDSHQSNISINQFSGTVDIKNEYGKVDLIVNDLTKSIKAESRSSAINLFVKDFKNQRYSINTTIGDIRVPEEYKGFIKRRAISRSFIFDAGTKTQVTITSFVTPIHINVIN